MRFSPGRPASSAGDQDDDDDDEEQEDDASGHGDDQPGEGLVRRWRHRDLEGDGRSLGEVLVRIGLGDRVEAGPKNLLFEYDETLDNARGMVAALQTPGDPADR